MVILHGVSNPQLQIKFIDFGYISGSFMPGHVTALLGASGMVLAANILYNIFTIQELGKLHFWIFSQEEKTQVLSVAKY